MSWQTLMTWMIVALAGGYLAWRLTRFCLGLRQGSCGGGCGCGEKVSAEKLIQPEELVVRRKK